jgi:hypothetical protein
VSQADKPLERMASNPRAWRIADLQSVARAHGIEWRQPGTSHVTFRHPGGAKLTVPAHKPIKPVYVRLFVRLVREGIGG